VQVTYRFDALPRALRMAIPRAYDGPLFAGGSEKESGPGAERDRPDENAVPSDALDSGDVPLNAEQVDALLEQGRKVTVVAVGRSPEGKESWIVAGRTEDRKTGASKPVAVRIDRSTGLVAHTGDSLPPAAVAALEQGSVIVVVGKRSKRGVIRAKQVVVTA
jgi:hypothetical protein